MSNAFQTQANTVTNTDTDANKDTNTDTTTYIDTDANTFYISCQMHFQMKA